MTTSPPAAPLALKGEQWPRIESVPPYASSTGDEAVELAELAGIHLDPWQALVLRGLLGERDDGLWAAFEAGLVCPRQNGKNEILLVRELAGLFLLGERLMVHSAHEFATSLEHFRRLVAVVEDTPDFYRRVKPRGIKNSHGEEGIELKGGQRIRFKARTKGAGRGFTADCVIFDEAMELPETAHGAILPTLSARPNPQVIYAASAVDQWIHDNGIVLARVRERGIQGDDALAYYEWSAEGVDPSKVDGAEDPSVWAAANPGLGIRISPEHVANEQRSMDTRTFAVERLCVGDWPATDGLAEQVISGEVWAKCTDTRSKPGDPVCVAFDVAPNRETAAIAIAGRRGDGLAHVEVVEHMRGTGWVAKRLAELDERQEPLATIGDEIGPAGVLISQINELLRDEVVKVNGREYGQACGGFFDAVDQAALRHLDTPELTAAVKGAVKRPLGDAWAWSRKTSSADITPLVAATLALWGLETQDGQSVYQDSDLLVLS